MFDRRLMFVVCVVRCCCLLFVVSCVRVAFFCVMYVVCCMLFVWCLAVGVWRWWVRACGLLCVVCYVFFVVVVRCVVCFVWCSVFVVLCVVCVRRFLFGCYSLLFGGCVFRVVCYVVCVVSRLVFLV